MSDPLMDDIQYGMSIHDKAEAHREYLAGVFEKALTRMAKAQHKFPQPNYVISKVAEEAGEVVKEAIHLAEDRGCADRLEYEVVDTIAMMFRVLVEGDQVHGLKSVAEYRN